MLKVRNGAGLLGLIYVVVGVFIAVGHDYITLGLIKQLASALFVIFLWFLVLLGVNLHIN